MPQKVSISIGALQRQFGDRGALEIASKIGADAVDFNLDGAEWDCRNPESIYSKSDGEIYAYFNGLCEYARELGVEIGQTHGRYRICLIEEEDNEAILRNARLDCLATSALHAQYCVMHSLTLKTFGMDAQPEWLHQMNFERFHKIIAFAKEFSVKIAMETHGKFDEKHCDFFGYYEEFIKSYERICSEGDNAQYFTVCVDTGHCNMAASFGNPSTADVIRKLGSNISVLHLNDNNAYSDEHKIPMCGNLDWNDILDALYEAGYQGNYNMELKLSQFGTGFEAETACFAVKVMRHMLEQKYGA